jgi:hypothetical protein
MSAVKAKPPEFRVGDWVTFRYGVRPVVAQIIEDRGPLGADRRRLYRIRFDQELNEPVEFEMPEDEMERAVPDKAAIMRYLKQGGLVEILGRNTQGGPLQNQPKAWLTFGPRGEIMYTPTAERGLVGSGATVPFHGDLPDRKTRTEVLTFLRSFDLTQQEAEEVMEAVRTDKWSQRG